MSELLQGIVGAWTDPDDQCVHYSCYGSQLQPGGNGHWCDCPEVNRRLLQFDSSSDFIHRFTECS